MSRGLDSHRVGMDETLTAFGHYGETEHVPRQWFAALFTSSALYVGIADGPSAPADIRNTLDNGWIERQAALDQVGRRWRYLDADTWSLFPTYVADFTLTP